MKNKSKIFPLIVSSPSGAGKTTVVNRLLKLEKNFERVITNTSRARRPGEKDGKDYNFWTAVQFKRAISCKEMAEWAKVHNNYYGIAKSAIERIQKKGKHPVLVIDVKGAKTIRKMYRDAVSVFLIPPTWAELEKRLAKRGDKKSDIAVRMKTAKEEMKRIDEYDYIVINNKVDTAVRDLFNIVRLSGQCGKDN